MTARLSASLSKIKQRFTLIILLLPLTNLYGQFKIINSTQVDTSGNTIFIGIENEILIYSSQKIDLILKSKNNYPIKKTGFNKFSISPVSKGIDTLQLINNNKVLLERPFKIEHPANFELALGVLKEGVATKEEIIANRGFRFFNPGCRCPVEAVVGSFKITFVSTEISVDEKFIYNEGKMLSEKAISIIRKLKAKDQIIFENIFLQDVDSFPREIEKFVLTIK